MAYQETEMSKRAREIIKKMASPDSPDYMEAVHGEYHERDREHYLGSDRKIDIEKLAKDFGRMSYPENFLVHCISLGLGESEVHQIIKQNVKDCYSPENWPNQKGNFGGLALAETRYKKLCGIFEITCDENFPDWNRKEEIPNKLEGKVAN